MCAQRAKGAYVASISLAGLPSCRNMRSNLLTGSLFIEKMTLVRMVRVLIEGLDPSNLQEIHQPRVLEWLQDR